MAVTRTGSSFSAGGSNPPDIAWPAGHSAGTLGIAIMVTPGNDTGVMNTAGWTLLAEASGDSSATAATVTVWYRVATSGAETDIDIDDSDNGYCAGAAVFYDGADVPTLLSDTDGVNNSGTAISLGGGSVAANSVALGILGSGADTTSDIVSSWTNATLSSVTAIGGDNTNAGNGMGVYAVDGLSGSAQTIDPFTATASNSDKWTGAVIEIPEASGGGTGVSLDAGSYSLTGNALTITAHDFVSMGAGAYALSGGDVSITSSGLVALDAGSYTLTGGNATVTANEVVSLDAGSYTLTGYDAAFLAAGEIALDGGSYALTGFDASITGTDVSQLDTGSYSLTGNDVTLPANEVVSLGTGSYTLTGNDATIPEPATGFVNLAVGAYTLTGFSIIIDGEGTAPGTRTDTVPMQYRTYTVESEPRTVTIAAETRTTSVPAEARMIAA